MLVPFLLLVFGGGGGGGGCFWPAREAWGGEGPAEVGGGIEEGGEGEKGGRYILRSIAGLSLFIVLQVEVVASMTSTLR